MLSLNHKYEQHSGRYYLPSYINSSPNAAAAFYSQYTNTFFITALQEFTFKLFLTFFYNALRSVVIGWGQIIIAF